MLRGAAFTIGVLIALGSVAFGGISVMAGGMSDAPQAGEEEASSGLWIAGVGGAIGAALCLGAWLI